MLIGINVKHKTPKKDFHYPKFNRQDSLQGSLTPERSCYNVHYYQLHVDFDLDEKTISGTNTIYFEALTDISSLQIDINQDFDILLESFKNTYATSHNPTLRREGGAAFIDFTSPIPKGSHDCIRIYFSGKPNKAKKPPWEGGFVWGKDENKNHNVGVACELLGASSWWPVKDYLGDEPDSMSVRFDVPKDYYCVSNGVLVQKMNLDGASPKTSFHWKINYPINPYNLTFYIGKYEHFTLPYKDQELNFYVLAENLTIAQEHFPQTTEILSFFEDTFGEYPFRNDGYKLVESPYEGMEHQTAIAYGNSYKNAIGYDHDYIILHESAHEWWGNSISVKDYADIWLHEGFATYAEALFVEHKYGYSKYLDYLQFYGMLIKNKKPVVGPRNVNYWDYKDADPYVKGALTLHTFRNVLNDDELFFKIIKGFYQKYKYDFVSTQSWIDFVNEQTHQDYTWLFEQYLFNRECPHLVLHKETDEQTSVTTVSYRWENVSLTNFPVEIHDGFKSQVVYPSSEIQYINLKTPIAWVNPKQSYLRIEWRKKVLD